MYNVQWRQTALNIGGRGGLHNYYEKRNFYSIKSQKMGGAQPPPRAVP